MKLGQMRYRVTLQCLARLSDDLANVKDEWIDIKTVWADIVPVSGKEYFAAAQNISETQYKIYIRYLAGVNAKMRVKEGLHTYELLSVLGDRRNGIMTLMAKEVL